MSAPPPGPPPALGRRQAALALLAAGLGPAACGKPDEEIVPYVEQPARVVPGVPLRFATSLPLDGYGRGLVATTFEGRPVKLEGNPAHPASLGATDVFAEAAVLSLYDPDRSRAVRQGGRVASWEAFEAALLPRLRRLEAGGGEGLRLLTGHVTSPTLLRLVGELRARFPGLRWHSHEAVGEANARAGAAMAFGRPLASLPRLERASVVLALDADPLGPGPDQIRHGRGFGARRTARARAGTAAPPFSRIYAAEPVMTLTGAKADHRIAAAPSAVRDLAAAAAAAFGAEGLFAPPALAPEARRFLDAALADLRSAPAGEALVLAGEWQPPEVHALAHWINARLGAPVDHFEPFGPEETPAPLPPLLDDLRAGRVDTLLVLGANPAYDAPAGLDVAGALRAATAASALTVHLGPHRDETAALCGWHLPESHPLEDWADLRATDGTASVAQPLIRPIYRTRSAHWLLGAALGRPETTAHAAVRETWAARPGARPAGEAFEAWWRRVLHDGVVPDSAAPGVAPPRARLPELPLPAAPAGGATLVLRPDPTVWDGRFANNAWLQECPKPISRQVWGNAAEMAPEEAEARGLEDGDVVRLSLGGRHVEAPVLARPGTARGVVALTLGNGRRRAGAIGDGIGTDAYVLRPRDAAWDVPGLAVEKLDRRSLPLRPQLARRIEGEERELFPVFDLAELARRGVEPPSPPPSSLNPTRAPDTYAWAMVIDSALCIGCNACVVACQSENNVPVVGPEEVARGRDMHWLRIDTYDPNPPDDPRPGFQPVPCMHCEHAPCEPVCPVMASVHDAEGLNVQVYNRCIGTRFCQANCPYKVRRFNFYGYADGQEYANQGAPVLAAQRNPEVTVRARGVMEKCTYCTQRISAARRAAERDKREIGEGEVVTACQAACPSRAIAFGDLRKDDGAVASLRREPQHHALLGHLGTRPRTTYLADVRNPNPALETEGP